ncbi:carboxypeptidase-like regulatory domain-containing protein [Flavobacterium proteolyticum]|uniref:Carboxypeptidase-like regulatory domain-containing protein n=1 Tax=Flavobacterium proteolyticum TaxID=2911683 RepID=A0ABR9WPK0_9FLAO|nr:carboxypeptidase-like regulatory domain-containing protein [Flavobacterium proteolyticum]MBE9575767.1 carboxypeptidase-like regulatory domain-containing protein [Flavobacterium proteolyticum]
MKEKRLIWFFLIVSQFVFSQIRGVVKDSISGEPIPYVNIWVENETIGTTSEADGSFSLDIKEEKVLVFSALGYETKKISFKNEVILLKSKVFELNEVVISNPKKPEEIVIGDFSKIKLKIGVSNSGQQETHIWGKFIKSNDKIKNFPQVKSLEFVTRSNLNNVLVRIRIFNLDFEGNVINEVTNENIIVTISKGKKINKVDLSNYNIRIPSEGIIIGFEYLRISQNRYEYNYTESGIKGKKRGYKYEPTILGFYSESKTLRLLNHEGKDKHDFPIYSSIELALKLTLTE